MKFSKTKLSLPVLLLYSFFCYLMLQITLQYIPINLDTAFLVIKQDEIALEYYKFAFFIHVYTSIFVLLAGFTQFSTQIRLRFPNIHQNVGRLYVLIIVFLAGPSGLILGYHANGGWSSQLAFCILAILWIYFTIMSFLKIRRKDIGAHANFMYRSFALTLSAITLRAWKYLLVAFFQPRPMDVYRWVAWLGWVVNLLIVEIIIYKTSQRKI